MQRKWDPISTDWLASFVNEVSKSRKEPKYNSVLFPSTLPVFLQIDKIHLGNCTEFENCTFCSSIIFD